MDLIQRALEAESNVLLGIGLCVIAGR